MSNSNLLLTAAISVGLALGPAQAGPSFDTFPHAGGVTQTQWHHHGWGWGWNPFSMLGLGAGVVVAPFSPINLPASSGTLLR